MGKKNSSNTKPARVALIGARGYTGQALINLLNAHENMDLCHVSSRELAGQKLKGYEKRDIIYENLTADDVRKMEEKGQIDCWVMALPNGMRIPPEDAQHILKQSKQVSASPLSTQSTLSAATSPSLSTSAPTTASLRPGLMASPNSSTAPSSPAQPASPTQVVTLQAPNLASPLYSHTSPASPPFSAFQGILAQARNPARRTTSRISPTI